MENASTIVLVCLNPELSESQRAVLEKHGYVVLVASDLRELDRISKTTPLSCAVLGEDIGDGMKHAIAALLCDNLPAIAILEEYTISPGLPDADRILAGHPSELLSVLDDLLLPYGQRHTAHLRRKANVFVERARELIETAKYTVTQNRRRRAALKRQRNSNKDGKHSA